MSTAFAVLCFISEIFVLTIRAFRIIEIVYCAALGAGLFRSLIIERFVFREEKLKLAALGTNKYLHLKSSRQEIGQVAEYPAGFAEL